MPKVKKHVFLYSVVLIFLTVSIIISFKTPAKDYNEGVNAVLDRSVNLEGYHPAKKAMQKKGEIILKDDEAKPTKLPRKEE